MYPPGGMPLPAVGVGEVRNGPVVRERVLPLRGTQLRFGSTPTSPKLQAFLTSQRAFGLTLNLLLPP
jgi:hypothetical protein